MEEAWKELFEFLETELKERLSPREKECALKNRAELLRFLEVRIREKARS